MASWGFPYQPRLDELDDSIVYYWCNVRTKGNLKNRHAQGLHVSTTAQGTTDHFKSQLMGNKFDLASMGHHGPAKTEQKAVKASSQQQYVDWFIDVSFKVNFPNSLENSQAPIRTRALYFSPLLVVKISVQSCTAKQRGLYS